jgi:hypothetical protein
MDLQVYYAKIRQQEQLIGEEFPIVVSQETADGGKAGHVTETPRKVAARLLAHGAARLASTEEATAFRETQLAAKRTADEFAESIKTGVAVLAAQGFKHMQETKAKR